jgi:hypothetical protein
MSKNSVRLECGHWDEREWDCDEVRLLQESDELPLTVSVSCVTVWRAVREWVGTVRDADRDLVGALLDADMV